MDYGNLILGLTLDSCPEFCSVHTSVPFSDPEVKITDLEIIHTCMLHFYDKVKMIFT